MNFFKRKKEDVPDWSFQTQAIKNVVRDFKEDLKAKTLLVIPTGGGKTLTAIRSVNQMYKEGLLKKEDKVLWVVHTFSLRANANKALESELNKKKFLLSEESINGIDVCMKTEAAGRLSVSNDYKIIVIDEAHHAAADTYRDFFDQPVGILGLTATPTRMDRRELPFKKISFSITFRELVERKVVLLPRFLPEVQTNLQLDISSLQDEEQLDRFNSQERNEIIADHIFREAAKFNLKKVVVFAGTNAHVVRLYDVIKRRNSESPSPFAHVGYIYGGDNNERGISNDLYLDWHYSLKSSILINCRILNEGYDDPAIDTIVMATPTNSILYYLQCIGRVVRTPEDYKNARAYVIEIVDRLPNVTYRIDNRWLYAEISDSLEPTIEDIKSTWPLRVLVVLFKFLLRNVPIKDVPQSVWLQFFQGKRVNFLIFNDLPEEERGRWRALAMPEQDLGMVRMFNDLSDNIEEYYSLNHDYVLEQGYGNILSVHPMNIRSYRSALFAALRRAFVLKQKKQKVDSLIYLSLQ